MRRPATVGLLVAFAAVILLGRLRLYPAPLHGDICAYALIGHEMRAGRPLYSDLWERKPPLLYATFGLAERVVKYGPREVLLVNVAAAWATLLGVYLAGGGGTAGLFAAALWTLLCADLELTANNPDPEVFVNAAVVGAVAVLVRWPTAGGWRSAASAGVGGLLAAATLYKHNVALVCVAVLVGHVVVVGRGGRRAVARAMVESSVAGSVVCLAWAALLGHAYAAGRLSATVDVLFRQNLAYAGGTPAGNLLAAVAPARLFPDFMVWAIGPAALVLAYGWANRRLRLDRRWLLWTCWAVGTWATVALTGKVYAHYYELWVPPACVAGGWAAAGLWRTGGGRAWVAVVLAGVAVRQGGQFLLTPDQWVQRQFPYYSVADQNAFGRRLGTFLRPDESFWELGEDNSLYFLSGHSPPSGLLYIDPLIYGGETAAHWRRLLADLDRRPPDLVVLSSDWRTFFKADAAVFPWLRANYDPWRTTTVGRTTYTLFVRRGGRLQRRLAGANLGRAGS